MSGTTPPGALDEHQAAAWVRDMFGQVAPRYDLLNHLLSFNVDRWWRRRTVRQVRHVLRREHARAIDLCCGTGDLLLALERDRGAGVFGSDFSHPMLLGARRKAPDAPLFEGDALRLPVRDGSFDLITMAFGFRNLAHYEAGLVELHRVMRPGGLLAILEFSQPPNRMFAGLYEWYSLHILPTLGGIISGAPQAYKYLPESVRKFPSAGELVQMMRRAGFAGVHFERMTGGIVALHLGSRPPLTIRT
jgi:demethylmenaquinone methyltransferase / 2-methoxy-6-polyprenyl-1,4-benzoquinol methylase